MRFTTEFGLAEILILIFFPVLTDFYIGLSHSIEAFLHHVMQYVCVVIKYYAMLTVGNV